MNKEACRYLEYFRYSGKWNGGQAPFGYELDTENSTLIVVEDYYRIKEE